MTLQHGRSAQHENVAIHIYSPHYGPHIADETSGINSYEPYTRAYFPQDHFDETTHVPLDATHETGSWTFGRLGTAYVALYSWRPASWHAYDADVIAARGMVQPLDLRASGGANNVWIVELADAATVGSFEAFQRAVLSNPVQVFLSQRSPRDPFGGSLPPFFERVVYVSPTQGRVQFGWALPLSVEGGEVPWATIPASTILGL